MDETMLPKDTIPAPSGGRAGRWGLGLLLLAFVCLATTYSVVTPLFEASDELSHYPLVHHYAAGGGLPVQDPANPGPWLQEGSQPPLYYWLAALVARVVPAGDPFELLPRNPHADIGLVRPDGNANMVIHSAAEAFPYRGTALAIHLVRGLSVLLGTLTVLFTYLIGREVLPQRRGPALAAAAVVAFTPMFLFISGSVNNDNLVVALATISVWLMLRLLRTPPRPVRWALLGGLIGLAALSKVSGLGLLPLAGLALAWVAWRRRDWKLFICNGVCVVAAAVLVAGWWYLRNWRLYGDPLGFNMMVAIAGARSSAPTLRQLLSEWPGFVKAYWGVFGGMNVVPPEQFYRLCNAMALLALLGLVAGAAARLRQRRWPTVDATARLAFVAAWPIIIAGGLVRWTMLTRASQGRLVFPAIGCLSLLLVLGWSSLWEAVTRAARRVLRKAAWSEARGNSGYALRITQYGATFLAPTLLAAAAIWMPFGVIRPAYARPPLLTAAEEAAIAQRLDRVLGEEIELLGYAVDTQAAQPGDEITLTLYWRALAPMERDYSVFIHLLDQNGIKIAQRDVYPGRGLFPTSQWQPGDAIADTYVIRVPANTFSPNQVEIVAGLYYRLDGRRLPVRDSGGQALGDSISLGSVAVRAEPQGDLANPVHYNLGNRLALAGYDLDRTSLCAGEALHLTLFYRASAPLAEGYTLYAQLYGPDGAAWAGAVERLGEQAGDRLLAAELELPLPPDAPEGVYYVETGAYAQGPENLPLIDEWGRSRGSRAGLTRIRVLARERETQPAFTLPEVQHPLDVTLGDVARLRGFRLEQAEVSPRARLRLTLYWEALGPAETDLKVFTHLLDGSGRVVAQHDGPPAAGDWPTSGWVSGQVIIDRHDLAFGEGAQGEGILEVGLYDAETGERLPTADGEDRVILPVQVRVAP